MALKMELIQEVRSEKRILPTRRRGKEWVGMPLFPHRAPQRMPRAMPRCHTCPPGAPSALLSPNARPQWIPKALSLMTAESLSDPIPAFLNYQGQYSSSLARSFAGVFSPASLLPTLPLSIPSHAAWRAAFPSHRSGHVPLLKNLC